MVAYRSVLVTGASAGIGRATALAFAWKGATVYAAARRKDRLDTLREEASGAPGAIVPMEMDVCDRAGVDGAFVACPEAAEVDVLVNNAGLARGTDPLHEADVDDWEAMVDTNIKGLLYLTRAVAPRMAARGDGHIVNLGSVAGRWVYPGGGVYCATKYAVRALSEGLRHDMLGKNVRVSNIEPGLVETEFSVVRFAGDEEKAAKVYADTRALRPDDVADAILWCCDRPAHVNVQEMVLYPTDQAGVRDVYRRPSFSTA